MPERFQSDEYIYIAAYLDALYGHVCHRGKNCKRHARDGPATTKLQIHHINQNDKDDRPKNLGWLCDEDNLENRKLTPAEAVRQWIEDSAMCVCSTAKDSTSGSLFLNGHDDESIPIEIKTNAYCKRIFEEWLDKYLTEHERITEFDAVNAGAFISQCNPVTVKRYLNPLISCEGPYELHRSKEGNYITRRKQA